MLLGRLRHLQPSVTPTSHPALNLNSVVLFLDADPFPSWALRPPPMGTEGQQQHMVQGLQVQQSRKG